MRLRPGPGCGRAGATALLGLLVVASAVGVAEEAAGPGRRIAVTFDDLPGPAAGLVSNEPAALRRNTRKLLESFREHSVPVVGFVNEGKLFLDGETPAQAEARTAVSPSPDPPAWLTQAYEALGR